MATLAAARIVDAVADAAERWRDADFPARVRATRAVMQRTGYTEPVVDFALDALFEEITREALRVTIEGELGSLAALDGFVARPGRPDVHYRGVGHATIVSSNTTIGVAIPAFVFALCAKARTIVVKDRNDGLVAAFAETIVEERPELGARMRVERWDGHDAPAALEALARSNVIVAFGGDEALTAIRARLGSGARFVPFGNRTSVAYVAREALDAAAADPAFAREIAFGIARDALLYDGRGWCAFQALFVANLDADPAFLGDLTGALERVAIEFPPAAPDGTGAPSPRVDLAASALAPPADLPRVVCVYPVAERGDAAAFAERHRLAVETLTVVDPGAPDARALAETLGAVRLARFGTLHAPPLAGRQGGRARIGDFIRWIDAE